MARPTVQTGVREGLDPLRSASDLARGVPAVVANHSRNKSEIQQITVASVARPTLQTGVREGFAPLRPASDQAREGRRHQWRRHGLRHKLACAQRRAKGRPGLVRDIPVGWDTLARPRIPRPGLLYLGPGRAILEYPVRRASGRTGEPILPELELDKFEP